MQLNKIVSSVYCLFIAILYRSTNAPPLDQRAHTSEEVGNVLTEEATNVALNGGTSCNGNTRLPNEAADLPFSIAGSTSKDMLLGDSPNKTQDMSFIDDESQDENMTFLSNTEKDVTSKLMKFDLSCKHVSDLGYNKYVCLRFP